MRNPAPPAWLHATGMPLAWRDQSDWRVLDTDFGGGTRFLQLWHCWSRDPQASARLHVVALAGQPPDLESLVRNASAWPDNEALVCELQRQWFGLLSGFHRLVFAGGRLHLTLCVGATLPLLREQAFLADSVVVGAPPVSAPDDDPGQTHGQTHGLAAGAWDSISDPGGSTHWDVRALRSLTRLCRRGSTLTVLHAAGLSPYLLVQEGWQAQAIDPPVATGVEARIEPAQPVWAGRYDPRWEIKSTRRPWVGGARPRTDCVVIGAGLAGAAVADALARRGRSVTVLDAAPAPGSGASGLPVGLFTPQVTRDDDLRSRLSRAGIRMTLLAARRLLQPGQDWALSGVLQLDDADGPSLPRRWPAAGAAWTAAATAQDFERVFGLQQRPPQARGLWHATGGWIKPARLVRAWLAQPLVQLRSASHVHALSRQAGQWHLLAPDGSVLAQAPELVLACAGNSLALLRQALAVAGQDEAATLLAAKLAGAAARSVARQDGTAALPDLTPLVGQLSWAMHGSTDLTAFAPVPVNGAGGVLGRIPQADGAAWFAGATYEPGDAPALTEAQVHGQNLERMHRLAPYAARAASAALANGQLRVWRATRWSTPDRLPIVGPLLRAAAGSAAGLWISTGMGSHGLNHAALCGECIAAQLGGEPLPLEASLHAAIDVGRWRDRTPA